jgi:alpha-L-rhamnosidase
VEVTGFPGKPKLESLEGLRLNSDVTSVGSFECSDPLFNRIQEMVLWTELSNLFSVQSDCPHREKFGYGGDIVASSEMALLNFDMSRFYPKVARDFLDAARPNGGFTETAPFVGLSDEGLGEGSGPIGWGTAEPLLLWQLYQYYGDRRLIEEQYEATKRWIELLKSKATDGILDNGISDHESLVPKPRALTGTAFYYFNLKLFARIAKALGKENDTKVAETDAANVAAAFNAKFLNHQTGQYDSGSQACQAFALFFGMPPDSDKAMTALLTDLKTWSNHLSTGIFGTKYLLSSLSDYGRPDLAYEIVNQKTFPGWGYMLQNGATTLWEHWAYSDNIYSHNHPMFGSVSEWFYKHVAGISPAPDAVGFDKIIIKPEPLEHLTWAKARYDSARGRVSVEWEKKGGKFELRVRIPVGATARVLLPCMDLGSIRERGRSIERAKDVRFIELRGEKTCLEIPSGDYRFACRLQ